MNRSLSCGSILVFIFILCSLSHAQNLVPIQALAEEYTVKTFTSTFDKDVDIKDSRKKGFNWYLGKFFGWKPTPSDTIVFTKDEGVLIKTGHNTNLLTASPCKEKKGWVGTVFGGGGYFVAEIKFNPEVVVKPGKVGWPSFWAMAIEHMANLPEVYWEGQPHGYRHFIEVDIMEYMFGKDVPPNFYGANMHDWFGHYKKSCPGDVFCKNSISYNDIRRVVPAGTDFNLFHSYGFLWVPASKTAQGYAQFFFDGEPIGKRVFWKLFEGQKPSARREEWTFGVLDNQHLVLILGTGKNQPMIVRSVTVWQKDNEDNWVH